MANKKVNQLTSKPSVNLTDLFLIADPTSGQAYKTTISDLGTAIGSGVSSVNGLVGAVVLDTDDIQELVSPTNKWFTDTRARAALSASSPLTYNSGTGAFGIQVANGSQNGYLSSADWTTFNSKQAALSGTGFVKSTGGTISYDTNTYLTTSAAASTYLALAGGTMTGALLGTSAAFSGYVGIGNSSPLYNLDVTGSGRFSGDLRIESTNPRIYLTDTDNNPDYFISNTDGTFTVYDVTNSLSRFTIGTTGNAYFRNAITGGGSITGESIYSNGIISAGTSLSVGTFVSAGGSLTGSALYVTGMTAGSGAIYHTGSRLTFANYNASGTLHFEVNGGTGALTINADTSASFNNTITATGATLTGALNGTSATFSDTINSTANGYATRALYITGGVTPSHIAWYDSDDVEQYAIGMVGNSGGGFWGVYSSTSSTAINLSTATPKFKIANTGAATFSSSVTATLMGVGISSLSSWGSPFSITEYPYGSYVGGTTTGGTVLGNNNYYNGTSYIYKNSDYATQYTMSGGNHTFRVAPSGTAGNAITWTPAMTILSGGNVGIGTASPDNGLLTIVKNTAYNTENSYAISIQSYSTNAYTELQIGAADAVDCGVIQTAGKNTSWSTKKLALQPNGGNVGIGTTLPVTKLTLGGYNGSRLAYINGTNNTFDTSGITVPSSNNANAAIGGGIDLTNNTYSVGAYSPIISFSSLSSNSAYNNAYAGIWGVLGGTGADANWNIGHLVFGTGGSAGISERMRITNGGDFLVGKTANGWTVNGLQTESNGTVLGVTNSAANDNNLFLRKNNIAGNVAAFYYNSTTVGTISITSSATSYNTSSDYRLKEDLKPINGLEIVNKIKIYDYKWKTDNSRMDGVLAHELQEVLPYAVSGVKDGEQMQGVDYSKIVPVMVQAIKDLKAELDTLKNK